MRALFVVCAAIVMFAECKPIDEPINPVVVERPDASLGGGSAGSVTVLAGDQNAPTAIALDADNVYWMNRHTFGGIYKLPKSGGTRTALYEGAMHDVPPFALDASSAYFALVDGVRAVPLGGGEARVVVSVANTRAIAVANGELYWTEHTTLDGGIGIPTPVVKKMPVGGGTPAPITLPPDRFLDDVQSMFAGPDAVYVGTPGSVLRIPLDGSAATSLSFQALGAMAFDNDNIYFAATDTIDVVPKTGGTPKHLAPAFPGGVAVDDAAVFFSDSRTSLLGRILKVPKAGGAVTELVTGQERPQSVAVDGTSVYWICPEEGTVKKASH